MKKFKKKKKNINNELFHEYFTNYKNPSTVYKKLCDTKGKKNEDQVYSIKEILDEIKNKIKNFPEKIFMIKRNKKIINIVECILYFYQLEKEIGGGLKILTPYQMLTRLPITLAQLKAGNNSEKLKNKIRHILYSLYRSNLQSNYIKV